jgi:hypothetical protein
LEVLIARNIFVFKLLTFRYFTGKGKGKERKRSKINGKGWKKGIKQGTKILKQCKISEI